jgi:hypothetical protein
LLCATLLTLPLIAMATEEPKFDLLEKSDAFELRQYHSMILAEVEVDGDLDEATNKGFRLIADYIFGNNTAKSGSSEKIAMTTPVTVVPKSEKIAMTAPVSVEQVNGKWRMHFVMPSQYTLQTLPTPNNPLVSLREVPPKKLAVVTFSGWVSEEKNASKTAELLAWLASKKLKPIGTPELARYNPPWTLPFLRRNEVMVEYAPLV